LGNRPIESSVNIRSLTYYDISSVVITHLTSFPNFFLTSLGHRFLGLYYESIHEFGQIGFVAVADGRIIGFVTGIDNSFGFYRKLLRHKGVRFAIEAALASIRRPSVALRLLRALVKRSPEEPDQTPSITLTSIAVLPGCQASGVGQLLEEAFESEARHRGLKRVRLETDALDNERVLAFYRKRRYLVRRSYVTPEGRRMHEFVKDL